MDAGTFTIQGDGFSRPIDCGSGGATVTNLGANTVFYRDEQPVTIDVNDGSIAPGASQILTGVVYLVALGSTPVSVVPRATAGGGTATILGALDANATSLARDGFLAAYDGSLSQFVGRAPGGTFRVDDEGALGTGTGNDADAFRNAIAKARAVQAAGGVGIVEANPTKTYRLATGQTDTTPNTAFQIAGDLPSTAGWLVIRGHGATLKLANVLKCFFAIDDNVAQNSTLRNIIFDGWVFDIAGQSLNVSQGNLVHIAGRHLNMDRMVFRNLRSINGGTLGKSSRSICLNTNRTDSYGQGGPMNTISRILFDDLDLGAYGGVGGGGANVVTFCNQPLQRAQNLDETVPRAAVLTDDITFRRVKYQTGQVGVNAQITGIFAGGDGYGGKVLVEDCYAEGSGDDNYEFPGIGQLTIKDSVGKNGYWENFTFSNNYGGHPFGESQVHILDNVKSIITGPYCSGGSIQANYMNGSTGGRMIFKNVTCEMAMDDYSGYLAGNPTALLHIQGSVRHIELQDVKLIHRSNVSTVLSTIGLHIKARGQACTVRGNVDHELRGSLNTAANTNWTHASVRIDDAALVHLDDLHVSQRFDVTQLAAGKVVAHKVSVNTRPQNKEPFTTAGQLAYTTQAVNGTTFADFSDTGGNVACVANPTTPKQLRVVEFSGSGDNVVGRWLDGSIFTGGSYQRQTGYRLGWRLAASTDGLTGIDCYITDDGTNSILNIDEVIAGSVTNKATQTLGGRVADAAYIGIRATMQGDLVTLAYFLNPATPSPAYTVAGTTTLTYTTTTVRLGRDGPLGYADLIWTPGVNGATIDNLAYDAFCVLTGTLKTTLVSMAKPAGQIDAVNFLVDDTRARIEGRLRIRGNERRGRSATTPGDISVAGAAGNSADLMRHIIFDGYDPMVVPTAKTGTTWTAGAFGGSGAGYYQCPGPWPEDARGVLAGGASSPYMEISRDWGSTFTQVAFATGAQIAERLLPGDVLRFTGAVPASLTLVPVR